LEILFTCFTKKYTNEEVNRTEPSLSVSVPCFSFQMSWMSLAGKLKSLSSADFFDFNEQSFTISLIVLLTFNREKESL